MKFIRYRIFPSAVEGRPLLATRDLLLLIVLECRHKGGILIAELEARARIKRAIEATTAASPGVMLKTEDCALLLALYNAFPFAIVDENLLVIRDDIVNAGAKPAIVQEKPASDPPRKGGRSGRRSSKQQPPGANLQ
jgi:hypothetical protein